MSATPTSSVSRSGPGGAGQSLPPAARPFEYRPATGGAPASVLGDLRGEVPLPGLYGTGEAAARLRAEIERLGEETRQLQTRHATQLREAEERGRAAGAAEAKREAEESLKASLARSSTLLAALETEVRDYLRQVEREVIALVLDVAYRVMRHEAQLDRLFLAGAVRMALEAMREGGEVRVQVPEADLAGWQPLLARIQPNHRRITAVGDPGMQPGECIVQLANGKLDLGVRGQLGEIERTFASILGRREAQGGMNPVIEGHLAEARPGPVHPAGASPGEASGTPAAAPETAAQAASPLGERTPVTSPSPGSSSVAAPPTPSASPEPGQASTAPPAAPHDKAADGKGAASAGATVRKAPGKKPSVA